MKLGVVLFQLGGPGDGTTLERFLTDLLGDPYMVDIPMGPFRPLLARALARLRAPRVARQYAAIGGSSPIHKLTRRQAAALEKELTSLFDVRVEVAMRYCHPDARAAAEALAAFAPDLVVLLPLYPQYCRVTTASSMAAWEKVAHLLPSSAKQVWILSYPDHPLYVEALVDTIRRGLEGLVEPEKVHLLFSAHALPAGLVEKGDPYRGEVERTVAAVMARSRLANPFSLAFQSRVGPIRWAGPPIERELRRLIRAGADCVLVVPVSFVCDHLETLYELGVKWATWAHEAGIRCYRVAPALNDSPTFIRALAALVRDKAEGQRGGGAVGEG